MLRLFFRQANFFEQEAKFFDCKLSMWLQGIFSFEMKRVRELQLIEGTNPSNFLHLKWIGDCSACCQMKSNSISNNTPRRVGHNFEKTCLCVARKFSLSLLPYVCVCFCSGRILKLKSKTWPAVEPMETAFVYNAFELSKVQGPSEILWFHVFLRGCVWVCVSHQAVNTLPLTRAPGSNRALPLRLPRPFVVVYRSAKVCNGSCKVLKNFSSSSAGCCSKNY